MTSYLINPVNYEALKAAVAQCENEGLDIAQAGDAQRDLILAAGGPRLILEMYEALRRSTWQNKPLDPERVKRALTSGVCGKCGTPFSGPGGRHPMCNCDEPVWRQPTLDEQVTAIVRLDE